MLPQKIFDFRLSETASGAFFVVNREFIIWKQGGARCDQGGGECPP